MPMFVELLLGGSSVTKILLKIITRLVPLWWATSRALEIVKALAIARDLETRTILPSLKSLPSRNKLKDGPNRVRHDSIVTRAQNRERAARMREGPKPVPVYLVVGHLVITWTFCIFALTRLAALDAPCETSRRGATDTAGCGLIRYSTWPCRAARTTYRYVPATRLLLSRRCRRHPSRVTTTATAARRCSWSLFSGA